MDRKYTLRFVHPISNPCTCNHEHPDHEGIDYSGRCKRFGCGCAAYQSHDVSEWMLDAEVMGAAALDSKAIARELRERRILPSGGRISSLRREDGALVLFPRVPSMTTFWHSIIVTLAPSELLASAAIREEAARVGWPTSFATDLDHDYRAIAAMLPREPFAWCLRADGTHVACATDTHEAPRVRAKLTATMVAKAFGVESCRFYLWDGYRLQSLPAAEEADRELARLAGRRYMVKTARSSTLVPHHVATKGEADRVAAEWEQKYGEPWVTIDAWSVR